MNDKHYPTNRSTPVWLKSLERSKAQIAAGQSVPLLPILDRLRASAERLEDEQGLSPAEAAPDSRS